MKQQIVFCLLIALTLWSGLVQAEPVVIEHWYTMDHGEPVRIATERIAALYNELHAEDGVQVNVTVIPAAVYQDRLTMSAISGNPPDVTCTNKLGRNVPIFAPLDDYINEAGIYDAFIPAAWEASTVNGQVYQLPLAVQPWVTFYNESLFSEAALETPISLSESSRWNWDTLLNSAKKISSLGEQIWGYYFTGFNLLRVSLWIHQAGGVLFDDLNNPTESLISGPGTAEALEFLYSLIHEHEILPVGAVLDTTYSGNQKFMLGEVGMISHGPFQIGRNRQAGFYDWDMAPVPMGPVNDSSIFNVEGLQLLKEAKNPEAAFDWMVFYCTDERAVQIFLEETGRPPAAIQFLPSYLQTVRIDGKPQHIEVVAQTLMKECKPPLQGPKEEPLNNVFHAEISKFFRGTQDVNQTIENIHQQWTAILND